MTRLIFLALPRRASRTSSQALAHDALRVLVKCPDQRDHHTLDERPNRGTNECYVNPFVLHGYYAKYLEVFFDALPADQLLVVAD